MLQQKPNTMNEHSCLLVHRGGRGSALQRLSSKAIVRPKFSPSSKPKACWHPHAFSHDYTSVLPNYDGLNTINSLP